jgi:hypothetical protein
MYESPMIVIMNVRSMNKRTAIIFSILNLAAFLSMIIANILANALPINGMNTGELSALYPNLFVPAGFTFSIWGVIYFLLFLLMVRQFMTLGADAGGRVFIRAITPWFFVSCLLNALWIVAWHYRQVAVSLIVMILLLLTLILIYQKLGVGRTSSPPSLKYLVHLPFSVYLGWISIATIANVSVFLVHTGWMYGLVTEEFWTVLMMLAGAVLAFLMAFRRNDIFYALVVFWAFAGIMAKRFTVATCADITGIFAAVFGGLILAAIVFLLFRRRVY